MIDFLKITVAAGKGGNGCRSFRREKQRPKGGPDGGDGGNGGSVHIIGEPSLNTLLHLRYQSLSIADSGNHGGGNNRHGARGKDLIIKVPLGTIVRRVNDEIILGDVLDETPLLICKGGKGGRGNSRFVTSVNQVPLLMEAGQPGEKAVLTLELKLLADVGIVGMPNAGKSTLLSACSGAKPKVADYAFTTVDPILGIVEYRHRDFLLVEVPGLIEGAHMGVGLGDQFLRHAERTRVLWHLVDGSETDLMDRVKKVNHELKMFNPNLAEKPQVLVVNKMDVLEAQANVAAQKEHIEKLGLPVYYVSAATKQGLESLIITTMEILKSIPKPGPQAPGPVVTKPIPRGREERFQIKKNGEIFVVDSPRVIQLIALANMQDRRVRLQIWQQLERMGVADALEKAGIKMGDTVRLGKVEMEWE